MIKEDESLLLSLIYMSENTTGFSIIELTIAEYMENIFDYFTAAAMYKHFKKVLLTLHNIRTYLKESVDIVHVAMLLIERGGDIRQVFRMPCTLQSTREEVQLFVEEIETFILQSFVLKNYSSS